MRKKLLVGAGAAGLMVTLGLVGLVASWAGIRARVASQVREALNQDLRGTLDFKDLDISLISSFPSAGVHLTDVRLTGEGPFAEVQLLGIDELSVDVALGSLLFGDTPVVQRLTVRAPRLHVVIAPDGAANYDLWPPAPSDAEEAPASEWQLRLEDLDITQASLVYEDQQGGSRLAMEELSVHSTGDVSSAAVDVDTKAKVERLTMSAGGVDLLSGVQLRFEGGSRYALDSGAIQLRDTSLHLNELGLALDGSLSPVSTGWETDLTVHTLDTAFKSLLSVLPSAYTASFADVQAEGTLKLDASFKGRYDSEQDHLPAFDLDLAVSDARVKYPDLPGAIEDIRLDLKLTHPEGPADLTAVQLEHFKLRLGESPFEGKVSVRTPMSDPDVAARFVGKLDLDALQAAYPLEDTTVAGALQLDVDMAGHLSDFDAQRADRVRATGRISTRGLRYTSADLPVPVTVDALAMTLSPTSARITELRTHFGESDVEGTGQLENLLPYALGQGALRGRFDLRGRRVDLEPFAGEDTEETAQEPVEEVLVAVPTDLDLVVGVRFDRVDTMDMLLQDVHGTLLVKDGAMRMENLQLHLLDGDLNLSGAYTAPTASLADLDLTVNAARFDLTRTFNAFPSLARVVPAAKGATGRLDSGFALTARLGPDGSPQLEVLASKGALKTYDVALTPATLAKVAEQLLDPKFQRLELDQKTVLYELREGQLQLQPVDVLLGGTPAKLSGSSGILDQKLDLHLDLSLPAANLKGALATMAGPGADKLDLRVNLGGSWDQPKVSLEHHLVDALKEQAREQVAAKVEAVSGQALAAAQAQGDRLVQQAQAQGDALRAEAKKAATRVRAEGKSAGDKLIADARGNPIAMAAAKEGAKRLQAEANKRADALERDADTKAKALVTSASQQRDKLISAASGG